MSTKHRLALLARSAADREETCSDDGAAHRSRSPKGASAGKSTEAGHKHEGLSNNDEETRPLMPCVRSTVARQGELDDVVDGKRGQHDDIDHGDEDHIAVRQVAT